MPNPAEFKQLLLNKYPAGVASDGRRYSDIPDAELTKMVVDKFPTGKTNAGIAYSDYLKPQGYLERVTTSVRGDLERRSDRTSQIMGREANPLLKSFQAFGQGAGAAANVLETVVGEIPGVKKLTAPIGKAISYATEPGQGAIKKFSQAYSQLKPEVKDTVEAAGNIVRLGTDIETGVKGAKLAQSGVKATETLGATVKQKAASGIASGTKKLQSKAIDDIANAYREVAGQKKTTTKSMAKSTAMGHDDAQFLAERNITPDIEKGRIKTIGPGHDANLKKLDTDVAPLNEHFHMALKEVEPSVPKIKLSDVEAQALRRVDSIPNLTETAKNTLRNHIVDEFDLLNKAYKGEVSLTQLDNIKKANWASTPFDSTKPYLGKANYQIGKASQKAIENAVPKNTFDVHELNKEIGKYYSAKNFLESLDGSVVKHGKLGGHVNRVIGAIAGHSVGGPIGTIVGILGGESITNILQSTTFSNPLKQRLLRNLKVADPTAYTQAIDFIKKAGLERSLQLKLPAPSYIEGQPYKGGPTTGVKPQSQAIDILKKLGVETEFTKQGNIPLPKNMLNLRGPLTNLRNTPRSGGQKLPVRQNAIKRLLNKP